MSTLTHTRTGTGAPLVLLHGLGSARQVWDPVVPALAERYDVIAVDLPGFGDSAALSDGGEPTPAALAAAVAELLDELGVVVPHLAGNSLGGWIALELAALRPVASVALLSPAGLWRNGTPLYCRISLGASRWLTRHVPGLLSRVVGLRLGRLMVLGQTHAHPMRVTAERARDIVAAMGDGPAFEATMKATTTRHYTGGPAIAAPVTVAFGQRDRILLRRQSRHLSELPAGVTVGSLPECGHVPMTDNPEAVVRLIADSSAQATTAARVMRAV